MRSFFAIATALCTVGRATSEQWLEQKPRETKLIWHVSEPRLPHTVIAEVIHKGPCGYE